MVCNLVLIYFDSPELGTQVNKLYKTLDNWSRDMLDLDWEGSGNSFSATFSLWYSQKNISDIIFY